MPEIQTKSVSVSLPISNAFSANVIFAEIEEVPKVIARASTSSKISEAPSLAATQPKNVPSWMDQTVIAPSFDPNAKGSTEIGLGYTMLLPDSESQAPLMTYGGLDLDPLDIDESPNFPQLNNGDTFDVFRAATTETLSVPDSLSPPITYSFQETSIARRIHRACAECAYQLVLDPRRRPAEYERIFRLTMLGRDREKIGQALKSVLDKGPHEELEFTAAPLVRVGGAGTHYPRRDAFGKVIPRRPAVNIGVIGPQTLSMLESATKGQVPTDVMIELAGFEGEWFDPYDVQGYLEEKGIFIDPTSSFAEAEIVEWPQSSSKGSTTSSNNGHTPPPTYSSPGRSTPLTGTQIEKMITEADADLGQWNEFSNMQLTAVGYSDAASGSWMNFVQPGKGVNPITQQTQPSLWENLPTDFTNKDITGGVHNQQQSSPQPRRKNVIIDVSKFVKGAYRCHTCLIYRLTISSVMTISGVCLGRTPGFRRRDVDRALAISSFDAF